MTQTAEMVERVAAIIHPSAFDGHAEGECDVCDGDLREARALARQVIAAMREPTAEMVNAGVAEQWTEDTAAKVWQAMVDAALAGPEGAKQ